MRRFPTLLFAGILGGLATLGARPCEPDPWNKPDPLGRSCSSCHSPDGIELAAFGYDRATIVRRATPHVGALGASQIADQILSIGLKRSKMDPMTDRPFQPGGSCLPGTNASERDEAFAASLTARLPLLMGKRIQTIAEAKSALRELLVLDPRSLPVGIPFNRLSEDRFHGDDHASLAHWIPDTPPLPETPALQAARRAYLAKPTNVSLAALMIQYDRGWSLSLNPIQAISLQKARSLLLLQHALRTGNPWPVLPPMDPSAPPNPYWEVGDLARIYTHQQASGLALPVDVAKAKSGGPDLTRQLTDMRLPWLWLGWTVDPSLQHTSKDRRARYGDWFSEILLEDGPYPAHAAFMLTKRIATEAYGIDGWDSALPRHLTLNYSWILRDENWKRYLPSRPRHRALFVALLANSFRMTALLLTDEVRTTGAVYQQMPQLQQLAFMKSALAALDAGSATQDGPIFEEASRVVRAAVAR